MKNVIGLEIYRKYQRDIEEIKKNVMNSRSENDNDASLNLVHNDEERQNLVKYFGISGVTIAIIISFAILVLKEYGLSKYIWIPCIVVALWIITFFVLFKLNKAKKKKILLEKEEKNKIENAVVEKLSEIQERLYSIVLYIICINDYYHELIGLDKLDREKKWKEILEREMEAINQALNYNISIASYQQYFSTWLANQEIYG